MAVLPGGRIMKVKLRADAEPCGHTTESTYILALSVLEVNY